MNTKLQLAFAVIVIRLWFTLNPKCNRMPWLERKCNKIKVIHALFAINCQIACKKNNSKIERMFLFSRHINLCIIFLPVSYYIISNSSWNSVDNFFSHHQMCGFHKWLFISLKKMSDKIFSFKSLFWRRKFLEHQIRKCSRIQNVVAIWLITFF